MDISTKLALASMAGMFKFEFSLSAQQALLAYIDDMIVKVRTDIISGGKTPDEFNELFDKLQSLSVDRYLVEQRVRTLKHMQERREARKEEVDVKETIGNLKNKVSELVLEEL